MGDVKKIWAGIENVAKTGGQIFLLKNNFLR